MNEFTDSTTPIGDTTTVDGHRERESTMRVTTHEPHTFREECATCERDIPVYGLCAVDDDGDYHCEDCAPVFTDRV